jgi:5-methyltetrahydrofolate--homocysteine methyltransferase
MIFKEDMLEAKERLKAWWDHEILDRPCMSYYSPKPNQTSGIPDGWYLARNWDDIEGCCATFEKRMQGMLFGAENVPNLFINYGPGILAAVFGCEPKFMSETVWFDCPKTPEEIVPFLESVELNDNNPWWYRIKRVTQYAAEHFGNDVQVTQTDLGGILDILSSFLSYKDLILTMRRSPGIIDTCRAIILEAELKVFDETQDIINQYQEGCDTWLSVWCPQRWYPIQCDVSAALSPNFFKKFVLPDIITQAEHMPRSIYHLDGPNEIPYVDDLLACPAITGIQWEPGAHDEPASSDKWTPLLKKIQDAGKNLVIYTSSEGALKLYNDLDPKGLLCRTIYIGQLFAEFWLPKFLGGMGGEELEEDE